MSPPLNVYLKELTNGRAFPLNGLESDHYNCAFYRDVWANHRDSICEVHLTVEGPDALSLHHDALMEASKARMLINLDWELDEYTPWSIYYVDATAPYLKDVISLRFFVHRETTLEEVKKSIDVDEIVQGLHRICPYAEIVI